MFQDGQEGLRVWESGIALARYFAMQAPETTQGQTIVELGSGTGIAGLALLKFTPVAKVVFSDYKETVLGVARENAAMQQGVTAETQVELCDWTQEETWHSILNLERIDRVIATDVIYNGSNYPSLAVLLRKIKDMHPACEINVIIPGDRYKGQDFLNIMNEKSFANDYITLSDDIYKEKVLDDAKENKKFYPGLELLEFRLYTFHSL